MHTANAFYSDLYSPSINPNRTAAQQQLLSMIDARVSQEGKDTLETSFTLEELSNALKHSANNKSPGPDGLPAEFYKTFWAKLSALLLDMLLATHSLSSLPLSMQTGIISLLFKKGDRKLLKNWRPISLLNADFKLIGKILAHRMGIILPTLLGPEQTAVKSRWIMDAVHTVQAVYDAADRDEELTAGILFLDQEKAFDRVDHTFLLLILEKFGFGPNFIKWIMICYQSSKARIKVNGHLSDPFPILRGVRQGDPLSPLLFTLVIECLIIALKKSAWI